MATAQKPDVTPQEIEKAHKFWVSFTKLMTYAVLATVTLLALMATFLV